MGDAAVVWAPATPSSSHHDVKAGAGLNSFSTPPTIVEINASSDWYQVAALLNRRISQLYATPSYFTLAVDGLNRPTAASVEALKTAINTFRTDMLLSAVSFGWTATAGTPIRGVQLTDVRNAITVSATQTLNLPTRGLNWQDAIRNDTPWGTQSGSISYGTGVGPYIGARFVSAPTNYDRRRICLKGPTVFPIDLAAGCSVKYQFARVAGSTGGEKVELYLSNSLENFASPAWNPNIDNFCNDTGVLSANGNYAISVPISLYNAHRSHLQYFILAEAQEAANTSPGAVPAVSAQYSQYDPTGFKFLFDAGW